MSFQFFSFQKIGHFTWRLKYSFFLVKNEVKFNWKNCLIYREWTVEWIFRFSYGQPLVRWSFANVNEVAVPAALVVISLVISCLTPLCLPEGDNESAPGKRESGTMVLQTPWRFGNWIILPITVCISPPNMKVARHISLSLPLSMLFSIEIHHPRISMFEIIFRNWIYEKISLIWKIVY